MRRITKKNLESGLILETLIRRYYRLSDNASLGSVFSCMRDSEFLMPVVIKCNGEVEENFSSFIKGHINPISANTAFAPDIFTKDSVSYLPIFSSLRNIPDDYFINMCFVRVSWQQLMSYYNDDVYQGIVLNGYGDYLSLDHKIFDKISTLTSKIKQKSSVKPKKPKGSDCQ